MKNPVRDIVDSTGRGKRLVREEIMKWVHETRPQRLEALYLAADRVRQAQRGDAVHLRGLIEISNVCVRECGYCGLRRSNRELQRYRMTEEEIMGSVAQAVTLGYGTVVMQAGEDYGIEAGWMAGVIRRIKRETPLAVTLSLGERPPEDLAVWRRAGADRYLLRFETSDPELYQLIHPSRQNVPSDRIAILAQLKALGYEVGSGIMAGIPGQSYASVVDDLLLFQKLDLDMVGIGPYISHPSTPLGRGEWKKEISAEAQVPNTEETVYKLVALTRLLLPEANIPSTTALATINRENGRELGLCRGANVVMPNLTPVAYRSLYEIYPSKACIQERPEDCAGCLRSRIHSIGRTVGQGPGGRKSGGERAARISEPHPQLIQIEMEAV